MAKKFILSGVQRVRELAEEEAAAELATANHIRSSAEEALRETLIRQSRLDFGIDHDIHGSHAPALVRPWEATVAARAALTAQVADAQEALRQARERAAAAAGRWAEARRETQKIDKLRERHDAEVAADELREEQHAIDEAAARTTTQEDK